ncbi:hypothetical protein [Methylomonas sp. UP202]|uniref:hypothetical protein n=1 Tax=Methylomonas sp. UP202 TaxID=3040943 RepID=UPI00247A1B01|nr:hypothetical protein [Methylomonas sp. UP202]WGS87052.1 hypothetical protein QC632_04695 [Methylomonas sp. UP202]
MKKSNIKVGMFALTALSSALMAMDASAACVTGKSATITLNKDVLATIAGGGRPGGLTLPVANSDTGQIWGTVDEGKRYIYLNAFLADNAFSYATLSNSVPSTALGGAGVVAGTTTYTPQTLPVVCATSATPNYSTTWQTGNVVSTWNNTASGDIGLAGVFKVRSAFQNPTLSNRYGKLALKNTGNTGGGNGTWVLQDNLSGGELFKLTEVYNSYNAATKTLTLKANLRYANATPVSNGWAACIKGTTTGGNASLCNNGDPGDTIGSGASWWQGSSASYNNLTMLTGTGTYTTTSTGVKNTGVNPPRYWNGTTLPTGTESQALVGTIEVTYAF